MPGATDRYNGSRDDDGVRRKNRQRKKTFVVLIIVLALVAFGVMVYIRLYVAGFQSTDDAAVDGNQVVVSAQMLGRITSMTAQEGDQVFKNERLVTLDDSTLKAQEIQAQANEELAAKNIELARIKFNQARKDLERATVQFQNRIIPKEQYDHVKTALAEAQAGYNIAVARRKLAKAQLDSIQPNLAHTVLISPIDGIVAKKWSMPGDVVQPAQPIYTLYDLSGQWIEANFKETQIHYLWPGAPVTISVDALPGRLLKGKVETIGATTASKFALIPSQNGSGNFTKVTQRVPVRISIDNDEGSNTKPGERLRPGMSAEVRVRIGKE